MCRGTHIDEFQGVGNHRAGIPAHGKPGHDVTVTMMGAVADGPRAANDSGSHVTGLSTTLMGGVNGTLLRLGTYAAGNVDLPAWQAAVLEEYLPDFASTPAIEYFHQRSDWFSLGELPDPSAGTDSWIVMIRGRFVGDVGAFQATHDAIASAGAPPMREMGDVAHLPFTGVEDPREFLSLDVWDNDERIEAMYGNPEVTAPFMQLFAAPPTLQVFRCV